MKEMEEFMQGESYPVDMEIDPDGLFDNSDEMDIENSFSQICNSGVKILAFAMRKNNDMRQPQIPLQLACLGHNNVS